MRRAQPGFTLVELLIVVVIIGVLAAVAVPRFSAARERAYYAALRSDLKSIQIAQEMYYTAHLAYAADLNILGFETSQGVTMAGITLAGTNVAEQGWHASATHSSLGADGCVIYDGDITGPISGAGATATAAGRPFCADDI